MNKINLTIILVLSIFLCILFAVSSCSFRQKTCKKLFNAAMKDTFDMVVVPGVFIENGKWSDTMKGRVYWSKFLYDKGIAKNIMYSGSAVYTPYIEGEAMALYAEALGIPKEHIFTETKAEHSTENIYYSYYKAKQLGFKHIALASDPFQTKLLRRFTRKRVSSDVKLIPFVIDTLLAIEPTMINPVIDIQKTFVKDFIALPDRESFWKRLRGTRGLNLDKKAYQ